VKRIFTSQHFLSLTGNVLASLIGFMSLLVLTRVLSSANMGEWLVYVTAFTFADMLRSGLIHVALIQRYTKSKDPSVSGSAWVISLGVTAVISFVCYCSSYIFTDSIRQLHLSTFVHYFPVLFFVSLPYNIALWIQQAENRFASVLYLRLFMSTPLFIVVVCGLISPFRVQDLIEAQIICYAIASAAAITLRWTRVRSIFKANKETIRDLLQFGKYSTGTLICNNLLKSSDTILISFYLGPSAVAAYNLPYKLIELIEIPLRSAVATSLPQLSRYSQEKNFVKVQQIFNQHTGLVSMAIMPLVILCLLSANEFMLLAGGKQYAMSANIFRIFALYSLLLPLDRFIGITLDSIGKPQLNLLKVSLMVVMNVTSNIIVLELFNSVLPVAVTTIFTICCGILFGAFILNKIFPFSGKAIFTSGLYLFTNRIYKLKHVKVS